MFSWSVRHKIISFLEISHSRSPNTFSVLPDPSALAAVASTSTVVVVSA
jgi:hypothetical protein